MTRRSDDASESTSSTSSTSVERSPFLSVRECLALHRNDDDDNVKFVDASWYHRGARDGRAEFERGPRIAGAVHFDLSDVRDHRHPVPRMLPTPRVFAAAVDALDVTPDHHHVILYGRAGAVFVPRVWFTFAVLMGHPQTSIMRGTLEDWMEAGGPVEVHPVETMRVADLALDDDDDATTSESSSYPVRPVPSSDRVASLEDIQSLITPDGDNNNTLLVDARGSSFAKGYIPGSINIPYASLLDPQNTGRFRSRPELERIFRNAGVPLEDLIRQRDDYDSSSSSSRHRRIVIICTCNSGVSACSLYLALRECDVPEDALRVYDGSWQEYRRYPHLPKVTTAPPSAETQ